MGWFRFQELQSRWESLEATSDTGLDGDAAVEVAATQKDEVETAAETGGDGDAAEEALGSHEEILTRIAQRHAAERAITDVVWMDACQNAGQIYTISHISHHTNKNN